MYKRVLIPVDGSETAEAILPFILQIAGPLDLELVLLRCYQPPPPMVVEGTAYSSDGDHTIEACEAYLKRLAAGIAAKGVRVTTRVGRGFAVEEILSTARETGADFIALTTHGRTGPARLLLGSVAQDVMRRAEIPVFLMRQTEPDVAPRRPEPVSR